jgi:ATP adenylyltransferase
LKRKDTGLPIRESSKVLKCGFFLCDGKRRQRGLNLSQRWGVRRAIQQEVSPLKLSQPSGSASRERFFQNTIVLQNRGKRKFDDSPDGEAMKHLWAPWRMEYILKHKEKGCIFCLQTRSKENRDNLVLHQGSHAFVMMNRYPYNNGHLMVVPHRHCIGLEALTPLESKELFDLLKVSIRVLKSSLSPEGFNIGVNIGKIGGAGEDHIHFHIVPRWAGDTNFMPILGDTKIVPESLSNTYQRLHTAFIDHLKGRRGQKGGRKK